MDDKEKSIMTDLLVQNQALRNAANGFKARCEELEAKNRILEEARENANEACAKWEGLYRAELEKKSAWVSVRDRLPDNEKPVLAHYGFYREKDDLGARFIGTLTYFSHDPDPHWQHESTGLFVTHWMPLPEPPKEEYRE